MMHAPMAPGPAMGQVGYTCIYARARGLLPFH